MKVINMDMNTNVFCGSKADALKCLKESFEVLEATNLMVESLKDWEQSSNVPQDAYASMQLVNAEKLLEALNTPGIDMYHTGNFSKTPVLYDRLDVFEVIKEQLVEILNEVVDAYIDLTDDERTAIKELSVKVLEQLSFFVFYEFKFDVTAYKIQQGEEPEVNEVVLDYVGKEGFSLEEKVLFMLELFIRYRPVIPSFDFSDEDIDMFYYHAGVVAHTILDNIDSVDPKVVLQLAHGEISPEEVIAMQFPDKGVVKLDLFS